MIFHCKIIVWDVNHELRLFRKSTFFVFAIQTALRRFSLILHYWGKPGFRRLHYPVFRPIQSQQSHKIIIILYSADWDLHTYSVTAHGTKRHLYTRTLLCGTSFSSLRAARPTKLKAIVCFSFFCITTATTVSDVVPGCAELLLFFFGFNFETSNKTETQRHTNT